MTVRQLPTGSFQARFTLEGHRHERAFPTQGEAERFEADMRARKQLGSMVPTPDELRRSVSAYAAHWLGNYARRSAKTREQYEGNLRRDILPAIGHLPLRDVTATDVQRLLDAVHDRASASTALSVFRTLSAMFTYARDGDGVLERSPILPKRHRPKVQPARRPILEPSEAADMLMRMQGQGRDVALLLLSFGMRWGELAGLAAQGDVDLVAGTIHLRRTVNRHEVGPLKNHRPRRLDIPARARPVLERLVAEARDVEPIGALDDKRTDLEPFRYRWLLTSSSGRPLDNGRFAREHLKPALEAAGIGKPIRVHDLRHTYASWQLAGGTPLAVVAQLVGDHPSTVERTYAHVLAAGQHRGVDVVDRLLG